VRVLKAGTCKSLSIPKVWRTETVMSGNLWARTVSVAEGEAEGIGLAIPYLVGVSRVKHSQAKYLAFTKAKA
jgi:hypothetical protein